MAVRFPGLPSDFTFPYQRFTGMVGKCIFNVSNVQQPKHSLVCLITNYSEDKHFITTAVDVVASPPTLLLGHYRGGEPYVYLSYLPIKFQCFPSTEKLQSLPSIPGERHLSHYKISTASGTDWLAISVC